MSVEQVELIDVLTPEGQPTGIRKPKDAIHRDGDWHRASHVWILSPDGQFLLQRRSLRKINNPGLWDVSVAGHISAGETATDAAVRETLEEIGLSIEAGDLHFVTTLRESCVLNRGAYIDNEFHEIFVVRRQIDLRSLRLDPEEVAEVKWVQDLRPDETFVSHAKEYALLSRLRR